MNYIKIFDCIIIIRWLMLIGSDSPKFMSENLDLHSFDASTLDDPTNPIVPCRLLGFNSRLTLNSMKLMKVSKAQISLVMGPLQELLKLRQPSRDCVVRFGRATSLRNPMACPYCCSPGLVQQLLKLANRNMLTSIFRSSTC